MSEHPGWPAELVVGAVRLRPPERTDAAEWSEVRTRNAAWLQPWEPTSLQPWPDRSSKAAWRRLSASLRRNARDGIGMPFVIIYGGHLVGQVSVSNIVRGALRGGNVGYWIDGAVAGRGIMPAALAVIIDHCFTVGRLHRIEVDIRPENVPSLRVVEKLGLRREGFYERFLDIDGGWRDHIAFAITAEELAGTSMVARLASLPVAPG